MKRLVPLAIGLLLGVSGSAHAAAVGRATMGCRVPADATKAMALQAKKDGPGLEAFTRSMAASGACIPFAKGVTVDVDERRTPLSCVRLTGDLSCYWVAGALVDEHPGEKGGAAGSKRSGSHRR